MKKVILISILIFSSWALAADETTTKMEVPVVRSEPEDLSLSHSKYFGLPPKGKTQATIAYESVSAENTKRSYTPNPNEAIYEKTGSNSYEFKISRGLSDYASTTITFGHETSKYNVVSGSETQAGNSASGMKDIGVNLTLLSDISDGNILYGLDLTLSPGEKILPDEMTQGNSFSGGRTFTPFIGVEKIVGQSIAGGRVSTTFFSGEYRRTRDTYYNYEAALSPIDLDFFFEYPMSSKMDVGFQAGLGKHSNGPSRFLDAYKIGFYGNYEVNNSTSVDMNIAMKNSEFGGSDGGESKAFTELTFALKRTL